jgi:hypothetical protein
MVKRLNLNEKVLRESEIRPGVSYQIFDTDVIGFAARVQASGARTFTIDYRHAGRQRRMTIGRWPEWSVTAESFLGFIDTTSIRLWLRHSSI